jgi:uncharacterized protein YbaP (TraB family)
LGVLLLVSACAQIACGAEKVSTASTSAVKERAPAKQRHSLWKVQGKQNTVYLLGSVHVLRTNSYPLPAVIEAAYTNSGIAAFETDIGKLDDPSEAMKLMSKAQLPEGKTLESELSPAVYKDLKNQAETSGLPLVLLNQFTPAMAAEALEGMELLKLGFDPAFGLDKHFYKKANGDGKIIVALEPIEAQLDLISGLTKAEGEWFVKTTLKELENVKKDFAEIMQAWETGDANKLEKLLNEAKADSPDLFKRFLTDRNMKWMPKLEELLKGKANAIVIVGAGHLVGKDGLVEMLKKNGYVVTQQ